jgi:hypothetical protein
VRKLFPTLVACGVLMAVSAAPAAASHSWGSYHWARSTNTFTLQVGDRMTSNWDDLLRTNSDSVSADWTSSSVLDTNFLTNLTATKNCKAVTGRVEACNGNYGYNGWLGLAQIWVSGSHITAGTAKANDTYLSSPRYNDTADQHVLCQEVGHTFGLGHQDESGADLNTCTDYANALDNPHPNAHDYEQLETIYKHLDSTTTVKSFSSTSPTRSKGRVKRLKPDLYVEDFGNGQKRLVWVHWKDKAASEAAPNNRIPE